MLFLIKKFLTFTYTDIKVKRYKVCRRLIPLFIKSNFLKGGHIMFCSNCGNQIEDGNAFCSRCGKPLNAGVKMNAANQKDSSINSRQINTGAQYYKDQYTAIDRPVINRGLTAIIGYLGWLGFLIGMVGGDRKEGYARYHLGQALIMNIMFSISAVLYFIGSIMLNSGHYYNIYTYRISGIYVAGVILTLLGLAVIIYTFVCWLIDLIRACKGSVKPLPIFGRIRILK